MDLEQTVLERIVPPRGVVASIQERADRLKGIVEDYIASHGIDVEAKFAGSFSKGTFLSDPDLDLFLMFPCSVPEADLKRIGLQAGEDILHGERMFSDHPYTRGMFEGLDVDMVPCYRIDSTKHLKSAVDRTPFHTDFINSHLDDAGRNQVRLLKRFMKGIGTYGAEQDSRGFSGYLCELLVVKYGTFRGVLEAADRWKDGTVLAIEGRGPKIDAPLVVYDPVDPKRNVASAVHVDTLSLFIHAARSYLTEPRMEFFFPEPISPMSREMLSSVVGTHGTRLLSVVFPRPEAIEDNLYSQLWKTQTALSRKLEEYDFEVLRAVHGMDEYRMTVVLELGCDVLPPMRRHSGPPVWVNPGSFLDKWKDSRYGGPFIEGGCWTVIAPRQYTSAVDVVSNEACRSGIGKEMDVDAMEVMGHEDTLTNIDPSLLTSLLDPRLPWERRLLPSGCLDSVNTLGSNS